MSQVRDRRRMGLIGGFSAVGLFVVGYVFRTLVLRKHSLLDLWLGSLTLGPLFSSGLLSPGEAGIGAKVFMLVIALMPKFLVGFLVGWWIGVRAYALGDTWRQVIGPTFFFVLVVELLSLIGYTIA